MLQKKITEIVSGNYIFASVLHYFGISFFAYSDQTLEEVCSQKGLDATMVSKKLESAVSSNNHQAMADLPDYPIELIIAYLKHAHHKFVKQRLPYLAELINSLNAETHPNATFVKDLKFIFPVFVKEFIEHIYEEEDELFSYVLKLSGALNNKKTNTFEILQCISKHALQEHALDHDTHENGMEGIRKFTNNYEAPLTDLHLQVIFSELRSLEKELIDHAKIENEVFFPKALSIEREVFKMATSKTSYN